MENENKLTRLRSERLRRGWSLPEVAPKIGCTPATLSAWEQGTRFPDIDKAILLSRLYDVPIKDLFNELFMQIETNSF